MPHSRGGPTTRTEVKAVIPQGNSDGPSAPVSRHQDCQVPPFSLPQGHFLVDFHGSQWASQRGHFLWGWVDVLIIFHDLMAHTWQAPADSPEAFLECILIPLSPTGELFSGIKRKGWPCHQMPGPGGCWPASGKCTGLPTKRNCK